MCVCVRERVSLSVPPMSGDYYGIRLRACVYVRRRLMPLSVLQLTNSSVNKKSSDYDYDAHKLTSVFGAGMVIEPTNDGADESKVCLD